MLFAVAASQVLLIAFVAPIVVGVTVALVLQAAAAPSEIRIHDLEAATLRTDLLRWVRDRDRQLTREIRGVVNSAGPQITFGSTRDNIYSLMHGALWEYRDRALAAAASYRRLAAAEGWLHRFLREDRRPAPLALEPSDHLILVGWREAEAPVPGEPPIQVKEDPSLEGSAREIWAVEGAGISWEEAAAYSTSSNS